jgi:thioredoxin reductase (NADPH)
VAEFHDVIIIGGGPAGLTAGIYLMRAGIDAVLVERTLTGGAPVNTWRVENYPGFPGGISGRELMDRFSAHAKEFNLPVREFSSVEEATYDGSRFSMRAGEETLESFGVIVATGSEAMKINIPGEKEFLGRGISYCATCDGMFFRDLDVAVIGGGDAAVEEGLSLANMVRKVYVVHRRDALRAQKILQERAFRNDKMKFLWNRIPVEIGGKDQVEHILLEDTKTGEREKLEISGVFVYIGATPNTGFLGDLVERDAGGFVVTNEELATKTPGLFVAGDVRKKSLRQISTAVGDGALAAVNLERYILEKR